MLDVSWGTVLWSSIAFLIVAFILAKFAWKPILASIKEREVSIDSSLKSAENARQEMANLQASNETLLKEARIERDAMLKDALDIKTKIVSEAKERATEEYNKILGDAKAAIHTEKMAAISELKTQVAALSIEIAERVIKQELKADGNQKALIDKYLQDAKLN